MSGYELRGGPQGSGQTYTRALVFVAILTVAAILRWELLGVRSLWYDEGYSLSVARLGWRGILEFLKQNDAHPAGYYLLLSFWVDRFGDSLLAARFPSFVLGLAVVVLTWALAREVHSEQAAALAALLVAVHPFQVMASNELRMYPLLTVLVLSAVLCTLRVRRGKPWHAVLLGVLWAGVGYTSYYGLLALAAMGTWLAARGNGRAAVTAGAVFALLYAPWVPYLAGFWRVNPQLWTRETLWWGYPVELLAAQGFGGYWPGTFTYHTSFRLPAVQYVPLLAPYLLFGAAATRAREEPEEGRAALGLLAWTWAVVHVGVLAVSVLLGWVAAYPRHLVFVQPLAACLVGVGVVRASRLLPFPQAAVVGLASVWLLTLQAPAVAAMQSDPRYQTYRYDRAAQFVRAGYRPGDAVLYVPDGTALAFEYYFRPPGRRVEVRVEPRAYRAEEWGQLFRDSVRELGAKDHRVWVVTTSPAPPAGEAALRSVLRDRGYELVAERVFPGLRVALAIRRR